MEVKRGRGPRGLASLGGLNMQVTAILASIEVKAGPFVFPSYSYYVIILPGSHLNPQTPLHYAGRMPFLGCCYSSWRVLIFLLRFCSL